MLTPIGQALDSLPGDRVNISEACHIWLGLLEEACLNVHKTIVTTRMNQALKPFHFLAYLMDPKYRGQRLSQEHKEIAREWLKNIESDSLPLVIAYEAAPYPTSYFTSTTASVNPVICWNAVGKFSFIPTKFVNLITPLLSSPLLDYWC